MGAATETGMKAKKSKIEDAKNATRAGVQEGLLPGGAPPPAPTYTNVSD